MDSSPVVIHLFSILFGVMLHRHKYYGKLRSRTALICTRGSTHFNYVIYNYLLTAHSLLKEFSEGLVCTCTGVETKLSGEVGGLDDYMPIYLIRSNFVVVRRVNVSQ